MSLRGSFVQNVPEPSAVLVTNSLWLGQCASLDPGLDEKRCAVWGAVALGGGVFGVGWKIVGYVALRLLNDESPTSTVSFSAAMDRFVPITLRLLPALSMDNPLFECPSPNRLWAAFLQLLLFRVLW